MYDDGVGVPQDHATAVSWFGRAAVQGNPEAQYNLGASFDEGQGVQQDYAAAASWYRMAAEQGYASAQTNLGIKYAKGQGVPQDFAAAHMWFNLAAASGQKNALKYRDKLAAVMTPAQLAEAQKLAREWKPHAKNIPRDVNLTVGGVTKP